MFYELYYDCDQARLDHPSYYQFDDGTTLACGPHPHYKTKPQHNHYDEHGRWIGADIPPTGTPCRLITRTVGLQLPGEYICELFRRYTRSDYGSGEAGFAVYDWPLEDDPMHDQLWLIDDAVRTPEGLPPARDPHSSPGPQTLLLPTDY